MSGQTLNDQVNQSTVLEIRGSSNSKPIVVGLYGLPGSGKTFLLQQLKQELGKEHFSFYEGSQVIASIVPGGLDAFQKLEEREKLSWRKRAIDTIREECANSGQVGIVVGHFMFWAEDEQAGCLVYTENDLNTFTHILYLDIPAHVIAERRLSDKRSRPSGSVHHLHAWQQVEKTQLRGLCHEHGILFSLLSPLPTLLNRTLILLRDFRLHSEKHNLSRAESVLDEALDIGRGQLETVLVLDADRTLAAEDTGTMFWTKVASSRKLERDDDRPLKRLFSSPLGYSYTAFRQATLLYEETADDDEFDALCQEVASGVTMYHEFVSLLQLVGEQEHIGAVIVSCGLRRVWEKVLEREGLSKTVKVIAGGRVADGLVVTADVKAALVSRLRDTHQMFVWAFGDSPLDLEMLCKADEAIVVVGEEQRRSKTMDNALMSALSNGRLRARQVVLPESVLHRLDIITLPLVELTDRQFVDSVVRRHSRHADIQVRHATGRSAAKILMTPMRNATVFGPALRNSHSQVGWYLAIEFLADLIGVEEHSIPHIQGHDTSGYRLRHENQTSIVALMRGGEPMALGVSDAFPNALFVHANRPSDIIPRHVQGQHTVVLVDSVVNSGKTIVKFVQHIRSLHATVRIVVTAGVVQAQAVTSLKRALAGHVDLSIVALRLSDNKFTGTGTTDTGNRLFNTTHLP